MKQTIKPIAIILGVLLLTNFASAAGLTSVTTLITNINTWLFGLGVAIVTMAIIWAGYKIIFSGAALRDVANVLIGALLIGAAAGLAAALVNQSGSL